MTVRGNRAALEQLFLNLLLNAAQASSESGRVHVRIEEAAGHLRVHVRDEGAGISPEEIGRVLEPFYSTREGGTGLGLPIASRIAKAHGGDLEIESSVGKGTTVTLVIARTDEPHQEA